MPRRDAVLALVLLALVATRGAWHALATPVFEGPDEPFHLDHALPHVAAGDDLTRGVVAAIRSHRCAADLRLAFGCTPFDGNGAFGALHPVTPLDPLPSARRNYEAHQPLLYYLLAHLVTLGATRVETAVLELRLLGLALLLAGAAILRALMARAEAWAMAIVLLLLPGANEALVRVSNDGLLFAWAATMLWAWRRERRLSLLALLAAGMLIKLSAAPVCATAVVGLWRSGHRRAALGGGVASLLVFPLQWWRGWAWGGTPEMNSTTYTIAETPSRMAVGLARSLYTFVKTSFWVGNWSFFRAPLALVIAFFLLLGASALASRRRLPAPPTTGAHAAGVAVAGLGFLGFAIANRCLFGTWGGVGGWYWWGWFPWLAVAADDLFRMRAPLRVPLRVAWVLFVVAANLLWLHRAALLYGS